MGEYSEADDPAIREVVDIIVDSITGEFQPKSIIIAGGFGRREASFIEEDGKLKPLSDCEVAIVSSGSIPKKQIARLIRELTSKTGLEIIISNSLLLRAYSAFSVPASVSRKIWRPSIQHYDLKEGSQVVYGQNILGRLPAIRPGDIPLWEGIRLMFNRMAASLKYFPADSMSTDRDEAIYWLNKVIFACQDALLLSTGHYHHSYKTRNLMFQGLFPGRFGELGEKAARLLTLAARATGYKLIPKKDAYTESLPELWSDIAGICDQVFRYIIREDMGFTFTSYVNFQQKYMEHPNIRKRYYLGVISSPVAQNLLSAVRMVTTRSCRLPAPQLIWNIRKPWKHIVYSLIPLVYFGISGEGKVDGIQLTQARNTLSLFKNLKPKQQNPLQECEYLREETVELWQTLCY